jgi:hypothetical protein
VIAFLDASALIYLLEGRHQPGDPEQVKAAILLCRKLLQRVYELLRLETELWAQEFQQAHSVVESNAGFPFPGTGGSRLPAQEGA